MIPALDRLLAIMARLRDKERGCPWDREQNFATIAPYTIEEAYEVADAVARGDMPALNEELGDLLFQVVFHARMAEEAGLFNFADVAATIGDKMVRRHPHVFGDAEITTAAAQTDAWEAHKAAERAGRAVAAGTPESVLDGVALAFPALLRAVKLQHRAARIGFDWPTARPVVAKVNEEIAELEAALDAGADTAQIEDEMGDLLFAAANLARKLDIDPEAALRRATAKFERRFRRIEALAAERGVGPDLDALDKLWQEVKADEKRRVSVSPFRLERALDALPVGFAALAAEARAEGHRMVERLAAEWEARSTRFDRAGEALLAAYAGDDLVGIGGLTDDPVLPGALRMRRFYVALGFRRRGIGRQLAVSLLDRQDAAGRPITVNAAAGSEPFWEALGFAPDRREGRTHVLSARSS